MPRAWMCGPESTRPLLVSTTAKTEMNPSSPRMRRSLSSTSVSSPTLEPSTYTYPHGTAPAIRATPSARSTTTPSSASTTRSGGTPVFTASAPAATRCRISPWTGMTLRGRRMLKQ